MDRNLLFVPITKIDEEKRLVYGIAAAEILDKANEIFDYDSSKPNFESWSQSFVEATDGRSFGNVRAMHGKVAAGRLEQIEFNDDDKQIQVCAKIIDDTEWKKVHEAVYTGFSIGGSYSRKWKDGEATRYTAIPSEISIVDNPCVPNALFTMVKMDGTTEQRAFAINKETNMITNDMVAAKAKEMAKAAGDENKWSQFLDAARMELEKGLPSGASGSGADPVGDGTGSGGNSPDGSGVGVGVHSADDVNKGSLPSGVDSGASNALTKDVLKPNAPSPELEQVWKAKDGSTFSKKADALAHNEALAKADDPALKLSASLEALNKSVDEIGKAKKDDDDSDDDDPKGDEEETEEADKTKPKPKDKKKDKAKKEHEDADEDKSKKDMEASAGTKDKSKDKDKDKSKKKFALGLLNKSFDGDLKKGLDLVACMARCIDELRWLQNNTVWEAECEGDNSAVPAKLKGQIADLCETLMMLCVEETGELIASMKPETIEILETSAAPRGLSSLIKLVGETAEPLKKAGARNSRADQAKLQEIHDKACDLGAMCFTDDQDVDLDEGVGEGDKDDADKAASSPLRKALKVEQDKTARLEKAINDAIPLISALQKRIQTIEDMPKPRPMDTVRAVTKDQDGSIAQLEQLAKDNPEVLATTLIKLAQQNPRQMLNR